MSKFPGDSATDDAEIVDNLVNPQGLSPFYSEAVPALNGGISALASANAPVVFADGLASWMLANGVLYLTLTSIRLMTMGGRVTHDQQIVAHLRLAPTLIPLIAQALTPPVDDAATKALAAMPPGSTGVN